MAKKHELGKLDSYVDKWGVRLTARWCKCGARSGYFAPGMMNEVRKWEKRHLEQYKNDN